MPDGSTIDAAIVAKLTADAALVALVPDGIWFDEAPHGSKRFVIVSLVESRDELLQGSPIAFEDGLYLVKAVMLSTTGGNIKQAAARIHSVLHHATLTAAGYTTMTVHRESRVRFREVDQVDHDIRWEHRGGNYRVVMST